MGACTATDGVLLLVVAISVAVAVALSYWRVATLLAFAQPSHAALVQTAVFLVWTLVDILSAVLLYAAYRLATQVGITNTADTTLPSEALPAPQ